MTKQTTPNYNLPQWEGSDYTSWFDFNPAFSTIDEQMKKNSDAANTAQETGDSNTAAIGNLTQSLNNTIERVTQTENNNTALKQQVTLNTTHLNEHDTSLQAFGNTLQATVDEVNKIAEAIGGDPSDPSTGSINESIEKLTTALQTAQLNISDNTDHIGNLRGLSTEVKDNLVAAINELYEKLGGGFGNLTTENMNNLATMLIYGTGMLNENTNYNPMQSYTTIKGEILNGKNIKYIVTENVTASFTREELSSNANKTIPLSVPSGYTGVDYHLLHFVELIREDNTVTDLLKTGRLLNYSVMENDNTLFVEVLIPQPKVLTTGAQGSLAPADLPVSTQDVFIKFNVLTISIPREVESRESRVGAIPVFNLTNPIVTKDIFHN